MYKGQSLYMLLPVLVRWHGKVKDGGRCYAWKNLHACFKLVIAKIPY